MTKSRSHEDAKLASFRADPAYASDYLNAVLEDGDQEELLETLRYLAQASCDIDLVFIIQTFHGNKNHKHLSTVV